MPYLAPNVLKDLRKEMIFVGGPCQVGKTTLAKAILEGSYPEGRYFNWDYDEDRRDIIQD
ncbi:MAG: hypothetical protein SWE60_19760 [Thermodesulfobacteriota bacterium]|nr:hypothetical protein [Thermodesulfobacteriota bacterium]